MKKPSLQLLGAYLLFLFILIIFNSGCKPMTKKAEFAFIESEEGEENEEYDGPSEIAKLEFDRTKDPALGFVPRDRFYQALEKTKEELSLSRIESFGTWVERGPYSDVVGASNGNTRANSGVTGGRVRAVWVDLADATGNTLWVGGVDGGLWKTLDITSSPATWEPINDNFSNMAITSITQNPVNTDIMYFATGEWCFNSDAVAGDGIFKSTDGGATWSQLASTTGSAFDYCSKILCDATGNVYVSTRSGIYRSTNDGTSWTTITPSGLATSRFSDMELSSTGRLHVSAGQFSTCGYRYTDNPSTVTSGTWTAPVSGYPASNVRIELGCNGNRLYALPADAGYQVPTIYTSADGGANWVATTGQPTAGWASAQGWYALAVDIDGSGNVIVGGLEAYSSTNGGASWTRISRWVGTTGQYVHADIHFIKMYGANRVLFGCDGGIHFSSDGGTTIRDRNVGLRIKQFFSVAVHPTLPNYFLAGAQDNGSHALNQAGLSTSTEVTGGDGAFVHIDQDEPQYQFTSYIYNRYRRSTNGGVSWSAVDLSTGTGQFINPTDYDDAADVMYCSSSNGTYRRWTDPQTGSTNAEITIPEFNSSAVYALKVSPFTANRVYFGTAGGRVVYVNNANTVASGSAGVNISTGLPAASVSCIEVGTNENNLMVSYSNYGVQNIWVSTNGGSSWTAIDGDLPDMPVRWCMFVPGDNTKAIIATETGVWITNLINGASTDWTVSPTFPLVRTTMLQYRSSDQLLVASTHGRGIWSQNLLSVLPVNNFMLRGRWANSTTTELEWDFPEPQMGGTFTIEYSLDGQHYSGAGSVVTDANKVTYRSSHQPGQPNMIYRIRHTSATGKVLYSNVIKLFRAGAATNFQLTSLYPNPVMTDLKVAFVNTEKGKITYSISNAAGQQVWRKDEVLEFAGSYTRTWNQSMLKAGIYIFSLSDGRQKISQKFIKQ